MRTQGQSKISSCYFCVWCKSRELGGSGSPRFPCLTPVMKCLPSDLLHAIFSYWAESHLESCQTFRMVLLCENNRRPQQVDYFRKKAQPQIFDWIPNAPPIRGAVKVGWRQIASAWSLQAPVCNRRLICTVRQLRLDQAIRNLTCGDLEIPLVVIGLGVTGLREMVFVYLLDLFGEGEERVVGFRVYGVLRRSTTHVYHVYY